MITVFLDSSVIISGTHSQKGASYIVLSLCKKKKITGYISPIVLKEVLRNLKKKFPEEKLIAFLRFLAESNFKKIELKEEREVLRFKRFTQSKDVHVVASAAKARVDYVITLDKKHLLGLKQKSLPFQIVTPGEFIKTIVRGELKL